MIDYKLLGQRIRQERKKTGKSLQSLANAVGIATAFLGHLEKGNRSISVPTLVALCNELHVSPNFLLDGLTKEDASPRSLTFAQPEASDPSAVPAPDASVSFPAVIRPEAQAPNAVLHEAMPDASASFFSGAEPEEHASGAALCEPDAPASFHPSANPEETAPEAVWCEFTQDEPISFDASPEEQAPEVVPFTSAQDVPMPYAPGPDAPSQPHYPWRSPSGSAADPMLHAGSPRANPVNIGSKPHLSDSGEWACMLHQPCAEASAPPMLAEECPAIPLGAGPEDEILPPALCSDMDSMYEQLLPFWMAEFPDPDSQLPSMQLLCGMANHAPEQDESEEECGDPQPGPEMQLFCPDAD